jgi:xylulokinase
VALDISEGVCLGAAILAGTAIGQYESIASAVEQLVKPRKVYHPREDASALYDEKLGLYAQIYPSIREIHRNL